MIPVIIPLVAQLLTISLKVADIIAKSNEVNEQDKETLRALIQKAKDGVTYIDETSKGDS